jgi:hypothetical protein
MNKAAWPRPWSIFTLELRHGIEHEIVVVDDGT